MQADDKLWLVFRDEGLSLHSLMYSPRSGCSTQDCSEGQPLLLQASHWWAEMRNSSQVHSDERQESLKY